MPVTVRSDANGCYARWGNSGKKYYFKCGDKNARSNAKAKAEKQGRAVRASGWTGK